MTSSLRKKWIAVSIYYDNLDKLLAELIKPLIDELKDNYSVDTFYFERNWERSKNIAFFFRSSQEEFSSKIQPFITKTLNNYFKENPSEISKNKVKLPVDHWFLPPPIDSIIYNEFHFVDFIELGGTDAIPIGMSVLKHSTEIVLDNLANAGDEWSIDSAIGLALQMHVGLVSSFGMTLHEATLFYKYCFDKQLNKLANTTNNYKPEESEEAKALLDGLRENFNVQKESILPFIEYLWDTLESAQEFDESWLNEWVNTCRDASKSLNIVQENGRYIVPEGFKYESNYNVPEQNQEKWPVYRYYLNKLSSQLEILDSYEFNILYTLQFAFEEMIVLKQAQKVD